MKENALIKWIVARLPRSMHSQSMTLGSLTSNGTPDRYFDGHLADLWIEFKQLDAMPRDGMVGGVTPAKIRKKGCYTTQQYAWMERRHKNGSNVWGVIGLPDGRVVIQLAPEQWRNKTSVTTAMPREQFMDHLVSFCTGLPYARTSPARASPRGRRAAD